MGTFRRDPGHRQISRRENRALPHPRRPAALATPQDETRRKSIFALLLVSLSALSPAFADVTADITAPIRQFIDGFNKGDTKSAFAAYAKGNIQIVDEFSPHQWSGSNAPQQWAAEYDRHVKDTGVTDGIVNYAAPTRMEVEGAVAYVIVPTVYIYKQKGKPIKEEGEMTFVLRKEGAAWKVGAWTWSGVKPHPAK